MVKVSAVKYRKRPSVSISPESLELLYDSYSDDEIIRLYKSGNLTEVAEKIALNEIKLRKLTHLVIKNENYDSVVVNTTSLSPEYSMRVIANNLRFDEAIVLSESMIAEGIFSDTQGSNMHDAFFPSGLNHLVRVDERYFEQALALYKQFRMNQPEDLEERAENITDNARVKNFSELTQEEQKIVRDIKRNMAMRAIGILAIVFFIGLNLKTIVRFTAPYVTPNIVHAFLVIVSFFILKASISTSEKGVLKARNGTDITKEDRPYAFWFEVIGGYIISGLCFVYGMQYFLNWHILPDIKNL